MKRIVGIAVVSLACLAWLPSAAAQPVASFGDLPQRLRIGDDVRVTTTEKTALRGRLASLTAEALELEAAGERRRFSEAGVSEVARRGDSVWNGFRNGLLIGLGIGAALGIGSGAGLCDDAQGCGSEALQGVAVGAAFGAGIGLLVDTARQGESVVYRARSPSGRDARLGASRGVGVGFTFRF